VRWENPGRETGLTKVRVGVIGVGLRGTWHARICSQHPNCKLVGVTDVDLDKARKVSQQFNVECFRSVDDMVEDQRVDSVIVATPDFAHKEPVVVSARAGKHVLVEKPLATDIEEAEEMVKASRRYGVKLMVFFENRFLPPFLDIKNTLRDGSIGEPFYIYQDLSNSVSVPLKMLGWSGKSNVAYFLMSHTLDLARYLIGSEFSSVYAVSRSEVLKKLNLDVPDFYHAVIRFSNGAVASLHSSWTLPETMPEVFKQDLEINGSKGFVQFRWDRDIELKVFSQSVKVIRYSKLEDDPKPTIDRFLDCVAQGTEPTPSGEDGLAVVKATDALMKSVTRGEPVVIA